TMGRKYADSPIIEVVCDFWLPPDDSKWDLTISGLIYEKVREKFPNKEQRIVQDLSISQTSPQGIKQEVRTSERIHFISEKKNNFVQVGTNLLAINCLKPYPTWDEFKPNIEYAYKALTRTIDIKRFQRIGLRYINKIEIPNKAIDLGEFFEFRPFMGQHLPQNTTDFIVGCLFSFYDGRDSCRVQLTNAVPEKPDNLGFLLDLDYFLAKTEEVSLEKALEWVEDAHREVEKIFEGCITDRLREIFQEVK
ncbi:MAG TPA: TIGR04255 family protein, partial [Candidatus Brocadiales bacterium]|nr:TIGR04255 family protein [Candidatus Brocadiales bacterium]